MVVVVVGVGGGGGGAVVVGGVGAGAWWGFFVGGVLQGCGVSGGRGGREESLTLDSKKHIMGPVMMFWVGCGE